MKRRPILTVNDLSVAFGSQGDRQTAVRNVSFSLRRGESLAIVGESGSGKSVTAKALIGLNPRETASIESGKVLYKDEDLLSLSEEDLRGYRGSEIAMIFQDPIASLNPTARIGRQIGESYSLHNPKASRLEVKEKVLEMLHLVGIPNPKKLYNSYPHELSGGMRQRVMIASALISEPKILIADEPTTALDVTIQAQILDLLKKIQERLGMSIIFITHDLSIVAGFCSRILVMYAGVVVESAPTLKLFENPQHPYTKKLLQSIPRLDLDRSNRLVAIEGSPPTQLEKITGCGFCPRCPDAMQICSSHHPPAIESDENSYVSCWLYAKNESEFLKQAIGPTKAPAQEKTKEEVYEQTPR